MTTLDRARRYARAFLAKTNDPVTALYAGEAAYLAGALEVAVAIWSVGDDLDPQMLRLADDERAPQEARNVSKVANKSFKGFFTRQHADAMDAMEREEGAGAARIRAAVWPLTHDGGFEYITPMQRPTVFYVPALPAAPVEANARFPWVGEIEAAWADIRNEFERATAEKLPMTPYVPEQMQGDEWRKLRGAEDWSAIHLFKEATRTPLADRFPKTAAALSNVDLVKIDGVPLEAFFSRLKPGAHIPPHYGLTNSRMTVHLAVDAPENCAIRVGETAYSWSDGEVVAFDDSFEHEAWNRSDRDRVVLIFEAHHPDLTEYERKAVERAYSVRQNWLKGRGRLIRNFAAGR
ncbi:MAG: aspartyl/asparaginyl beta-hydroxylase domain-containing protein [Parvularculaceae bacterium]|nr:aspartyl/asparaginyl beta-hydroxylase domain-containing protein [Parvularculaceae bacterium]